MGRKGGGRAAFMRSVLQHAEDSEEDAPVAKDSGSKSKSAAVEGKKKDKTSDRASKFLVGDDDEPAAVPDSSAGRGENGETRGQMLQRHKKEQKAVKDQVKKLGKKNKEEGLALQAALDARHAEELAAFDAAAALERLEVEEDGAPAQPRVSKAMKRRQQRQREDAERSARIDEEKAALGETLREREEAALQEQLAGEGLGVHDIVPDGHCLYRALEHQLRLQGEQGSSYLELRRAAAQHMRAHDADFRPFIAEDDLAAPSEEADDLLESYCRELESTAVWGGHLELEALSAALDRPIAVFAAEEAPQVLGAERAGQRLRVCFMRHAYGLGDHYNSVVPLSDVGSNEEDEAA